MANTSVRINIRGDADLSQLISRAEDLDGRKVTVGPQGTRNRNLAKIHEYGVVIQVTPKMRAFLASQGLHLKPTTTTITIPERSFIRNGWDTHANGILNAVEREVVKFVHDESDVNEVLDLAGDETASIIRFFARELRNPALNPFTIERKGSSDPLIESGEMVDSIDYETS